MNGVKAMLLVWVLGLGVVACEPDPITLNFIFPAERNFLYSETVQVSMVRAEAGTTLDCAQLLQWATNNIGGFEAEQEYRGVSVCDLRDGGLTFKDIGEHERAFVAVIRGLNNRFLLTGCVVAETSLDRKEIDLFVSTHPDYATNVAAVGGLTCANIEEKCVRGCR
jgi:hypothetical protein